MPCLPGAAPRRPPGLHLHLQGDDDDNVTLMMMMVNRPELFAFSVARLHQPKVLGIAYKKPALKVIKKGDDFDFSFKLIGDLRAQC